MAVIDKTTVELDQLYLDESNPRFDPVDSQEAAIELLCDNEDVYSLAADITKVGLSQIERLAVLGSRLIHSQKATAVASATPDRKLAASLS